MTANTRRRPTSERHSQHHRKINRNYGFAVPWLNRRSP
jgi:hypothetical protein